MVGRRGVEVDVGVYPRLLPHHLLDDLGHAEPAGLPRLLAEVPRHPAQVGGAGVLGAVDAVAEAGHPALAGEHAADGVLDPPVVRVAADGEQHPHDGGVGPAVQGALQRRDPRHDGRVEVGEGGRRHPRRERRRVELVVGVENQPHVERAGGEGARALSGQQVEEVGGVTQHRVGCERRAPRGEPAQRRHQGAGLRRQPHRLAPRGGGRVVARVGIVVGEHGHPGAHRVHEVAGRQRAEQPDDGLREGAVAGQLGLQVAELGPGRQPAAPQQVADLLERGVPRQIVDVVPAVREHAAPPVDMADARGGRDDLVEPRRRGPCGHGSRRIVVRAANRNRPAGDVGNDGRAHGTAGPVPLARARADHGAPAARPPRASV